MALPEALPKRARAREERARLRAKGLKPGWVWVPDTNDPAFDDRIDRQAAAANHADAEDGVMAWVEALQEDMDWDG